MKQVTAAIIIKNQKVLIAQRSKDDRLALKWEFPGGKIEDGETPEQCLAREIKEELNLEILVTKHFLDNVYEYESGTIVLKCFFAQVVAGKLELNVHAKAQWVGLSDLLNYDLAPADIAVAAKLQHFI